MARESNLNRLIRFSNILKEYRTFNNGKEGIINYDYSCPEYQILKEKYHLEEIAKEGTSLEKAKRLLHYFAARLYHCPWYDNHVECNSLKLLEYAFENEKQGINCLNKSKILQECLLALHIPARRVSICPYSPYDFDSHVVLSSIQKSIKNG